MNISAFTIDGRISRRHRGSDSSFRIRAIDALFKGEARQALDQLSPEQKDTAIAAALRLATQQWNNIGHQLTDVELVLLEGWTNRRLPRLEHGDVMTVHFPDGCILGEIPRLIHREGAMESVRHKAPLVADDWCPHPTDSTLEVRYAYGQCLVQEVRRKRDYIIPNTQSVKET